MPEDQIEFAPFAAINDFMRSDFRQQVLTQVYRRLSDVSSETRIVISQMTRANVQVQGFRNPLKAPESRLARGAEKIFEENSVFAAYILQGWFEANTSLAQRVFGLLTEIEDWEVLPLDANRTQLPGFFVSWPKGFDFERLSQSFREHHPESTAADDEVSLMVVWISMRLPYREAESDRELDDQL